MTTTIKELLKLKGETVHSIKSDESATKALKKMNDKTIGALVVMNQGKVAGIISERDLLKNYTSNLEKQKVSEIMTPSDKLLIGHENDTIEYAMNIFSNNSVRHLPIFKDNNLIGLISIRDVVKAQLKDATFENRYLKAYIHGSYPI